MTTIGLNQPAAAEGRRVFLRLAWEVGVPVLSDGHEKI